MHTRLASLAAATLLLSTACGRSPTPAATKEAWDEVNDPLRLGTDYERNFKMLPLAGALDKTPWSDTYWPSYMGGVAYRWNGTPSEGFAYTAPNAATVAKMTPEELAALSPAEKFDIARGKMDYPLLASERARTRPSSPSWEGICHGWAPAALLYDEPKAVLVDGPGGLKIPFGSADIKALLDLYVGNNAWTRCRCDPRRRGLEPAGARLFQPHRPRLSAAVARCSAGHGRRDGYRNPHDLQYRNRPKLGAGRRHVPPKQPKRHL
ncbi:MAG: hypothetical protein NTZ90_17130 [Proteobacteria bacterium]|nr:hypothetical protein [Pseudomonadota bacterium]